MSVCVCVCVLSDGETSNKLRDTNAVDKLNSFGRTFLDEVRKGFREIKQQRTKKD